MHIKLQLQILFCICLHVLYCYCVLSQPFSISMHFSHRKKSGWWWLHNSYFTRHSAPFKSNSVDSLIRFSKTTVLHISLWVFILLLTFFGFVIKELRENVFKWSGLYSLGSINSDTQLWKMGQVRIFYQHKLHSASSFCFRVDVLRFPM